MALFVLHMLSLLVIRMSSLGASFIDLASILLIHVPVCASTKSVAFNLPYKKYCSIYVKYEQSRFVKYTVLVSHCSFCPVFDYSDRHLRAQTMLFFVFCSAHSQ